MRGKRARQLRSICGFPFPNTGTMTPMKSELSLALPEGPPNGLPGYFLRGCRYTYRGSFQRNVYRTLKRIVSRKSWD